MEVVNLKIEKINSMLNSLDDVEFDIISNYIKNNSKTKNNLDKWLSDFIESNKKIDISDEEINQFVEEAKSKRYGINYWNLEQHPH